MIRQVDPFHWNFSHIYFFVVVRNHNIIDTSFLEFPYNSWIRLDKSGKNSVHLLFLFTYYVKVWYIFEKKSNMHNIFFKENRGNCNFKRSSLNVFFRNKMLMLHEIVLRFASKFAVYFEYENHCIFFHFMQLFSNKPLSSLYIDIDQGKNKVA